MIVILVYAINVLAKAVVACGYTNIHIGIIGDIYTCSLLSININRNSFLANFGAI